MSRTRIRLGGTEGNERLTIGAALVLTVLLAAEGITLLRLDRLLTLHMAIGLMLIPPVLLKLASTGYRFARYYTRAPEYRRKGPPLLALRVLAPVLVLATLCVLGTGIWLMALGHYSGTVLTLHKASFIAWAVVFGIHFLAYLPRALRSLGADRSAPRRREVPAAWVRALLVAASPAAGLALALVLLSAIHAWRR